MHRLLVTVSASLAPGQARQPSRHAEAIPLRPAQPAAHRISLAYHSGWEKPILHNSVCGGEWTQRAFEQVTSGGGSWKHVQLEAQAACSNGAPLAEFVIQEGPGRDCWDKAAAGANYQIHLPGRYLLRHGSISPVTAPAVLLVSDLDDTMIGDDEATAAFTRWWRESGVPAGGRLVYNTGRALDLFEQLLEERGHVMAEPDLLISSLGTKIYHKGRRGWEEDAAYGRLLGEGWSLDAVREACYAALAAVGKDAMHFRPPNEMNEYKVTCGVRLDVVDQVTAAIRETLGAAGVQHRLVVSGSGGWRFMDLVPRQAGKLQALEYARSSLGFAPEQTVACGDSGNDIDMLEGRHYCVVVGNAQPDLRTWAEQRQQLLRQEAAAASGGSGGGDGTETIGIHLAEGHRAWGILEGLQQFGFA